MHANRRLFLSYGRGDDEAFVSRLYEDLVRHGFEVWYDRQDMPSRGLTFHQEIRDAITNCDRVLLIVGPHALSSDYVRQEWMFAWSQADKIVTPIIRLGDFDLVPEDLRLLHTEDFRDDKQYESRLERLVEILSEPMRPLGKLIAFRSLPEHYLARSEQVRTLRDALRMDLDSPAVTKGMAAFVGIHGMGGVGKSFVANLVARDRFVREAFPDGILWVGFGRNPNIQSLLQHIHRCVGGDGKFEDPIVGRELVKSLLQDKAVLFVMDDVWKRDDAEVLNFLDNVGGRCRALITTRDMGLLNAIGGKHFPVTCLTDFEARELLAQSADLLPSQLEFYADRVLEKCGNLPLAISIVGALFREGTPWSDILDAFNGRDLEFFEAEHAAETQHLNLWMTIEISVERLDETTQRCLGILTVFDQSIAIPSASIETLWAAYAGLEPRASRRILVKLNRRSLLSIRENEGNQKGLGDIVLHDLVKDFCFRYSDKQLGNRESLHRELIEAYRSKCTSGWHTGPDDGYFFQNFAQHLIDADKSHEFRDLLFDIDWIDAKLKATDFLSLISDTQRFPRDLEVCSLHRMLRLSGHILVRDSSSLPDQIYGRSFSATGEKLCGLRRQVKDLERTWLRPLTSFLTGPDDQLQCTLAGHTSGVFKLAMDSSGLRLMSSAVESTVYFWDLENGTAITTIDASVFDCSPTIAISTDGSIGIVAGEEGGIEVWDLITLQKLNEFESDRGPDVQIAISENGERVAVNFQTKIEVLGGEFAKPIWLSNRSASAIALSDDGRLLAVGLNEGTVLLFAADTGDLLATLSGSQSRILLLRFGADNRLSAVSKDAWRIWDWKEDQVSIESAVTREPIAICDRLIVEQTGRASVQLRTSGMKNCVVSLTLPDPELSAVAIDRMGKRLVTASLNARIRVWDVDKLFANSDREAKHGGSVWIAYLSEDGTHAITGASDGSLLHWSFADPARPKVKVIENAAGAAQIILPGKQKNQAVVVCLKEQAGDYNSYARCFASALSLGGQPELAECGMLYDVRTGELLRKLNFDSTWSVESRTASQDLGVQNDSSSCIVFDLRRNSIHRELKSSDAWRLVSSCISRDGRWVLATSQWNRAFLWDVERSKMVRILDDFNGTVAVAAFTHDGEYIVTGCQDLSVKVWHRESGKLVATFYGEAGITAVSVSANNNILCGEESGKVHLLQWNPTHQRH